MIMPTFTAAHAYHTHAATFAGYRHRDADQDIAELTALARTIASTAMATRYAMNQMNVDGPRTVSPAPLVAMQLAEAVDGQFSPQAFAVLVEAIGNHFETAQSQLIAAE